MRLTETGWARMVAHHKLTGKKFIFTISEPKKLKGDLT